MVLNATFKKISVLLVEETRVPAGNHRPATSHWQNLSHNVVSSTPPEFELTTDVMNSNLDQGEVYNIMW